MSFHPKSITDLRSGVEKRRSSREVERSTFARFLRLMSVLEQSGIEFYSKVDQFGFRLPKLGAK
jgi:hypothetical protein